ncbi:MAG: SOS response-associated peptidase [Bacilli bacterium]|nr:SOS response-associated peptidase [Bacilli bacterium]MBN2696989.1 SOS response-associated peptidase [Bacilli bacterium]
MCGRFTLTFDEYYLNGFLRDRFDIFDPLKKLTLPRYNIAPGQDVIAVIHDGKSYRAGMLKWGFVPFYAKDQSQGIINARSETLATNRAFASSFRKRRCLILADGFYEWKRDVKPKQPYHFQLNDKGIFAMAGIWSQTQLSEENKLFSTAIVTTSANATLDTIHDRMPVILDEDEAKMWLDMDITDSQKLESLLKPFSPEAMSGYPVSAYVNNSKNEGSECLRRI